jgi:hypothetical protein
MEPAQMEDKAENPGNFRNAPSMAQGEIKKIGFQLL